MKSNSEIIKKKNNNTFVSISIFLKVFKNLCLRHTVPKLTQDGNTMIEIFVFGSDRENIGPFVRAS